MNIGCNLMYVLGNLLLILQLHEMCLIRNRMMPLEMVQEII